MKRLLTLLALVLCSCAETFVGEEIARPNRENLRDLTAQFAEEETRTYVENGEYLRWHEDDRLTAFYGNTLNRQYKFNGATGDNSGTFSLVPSDQLGTGNSFDCIYAVYPYDETASITETGEISLTLPAVQNYAENSFGRGANTMIAVTENVEDTFLSFKNACGYLKLKLYNAEGATIKSIEVMGNNEERLAGAATVITAFGEAPQLTMADDATTSVRLDCGEGVTLGTTAETATEFWIVLPATTFAEGLTIIATDTDGGIFEKSTTKEIVIERNAIQPMSALNAEFVINIPKPANNEIWYTNGSTTEPTTPNNTDAFGANIISNTYDAEKKCWVIKFDGEVTSIGENAFYNCSSLTSVSISDSVTTIGECAFEDCSSLTRVTIPDSVTTIGSYAFYGCTFELIINSKIIEKNYDYSHRPSSGSGWLSGASLTSITIGDSVTSIGNYAFYNCSSLTSITIPNSVTSIGNYTFYNCRSLTSITIPDSVTSIGNYAFDNCSSLTSVTIPDSVTSIGKNVFYGCDSLQEFRGELASEDGRCIIMDGVLKFFAPAGLYEYTIPDSVATIGENAFKNCSSLTSITIPDSVTTIGEDAFYNCNNLTSITIPDSVTTIGNYALYNCSSLTSVIIGDSVTSIGGGAFYDCDSLTSVTIPDSVTSIGNYAFKYCNSLTSVTIPDSVTSIGEEVFYGCRSLISVIIGDSVTTIGNYAFYDCDSLTSVTIPDSVTTIGDDAFASCGSLTSVTIGNSVTSIGNYAFGGYGSLSSVYCKATTPPSLGENVFRYWDGDCETYENIGCKIYVPMESVDVYDYYWSEYAYYIVGYYFDNEESGPQLANNEIWYTNGSTTDATAPYDTDVFGANIISNTYDATKECWVIKFDGNVTKIGDYAFLYCSGLTSITIPNSVTSIGEATFFGCTNLSNITFGNGVTTIGQSAFCYCASLTSVVFHDSLTLIGDGAFKSCESLASVIMGNCIKEIGNSAFAGCSSLTSVAIPDSVTTIGEAAFTVCSSLQEIRGKFASEDRKCLIIDGTLNSVAHAGLTQYTIPNGVTTIGRSAFSGCTSLTSVTIPNSVTAIGDYTFFECSNLASVYCKAITPPSMGVRALQYLYLDVYEQIIDCDIYVPTESVYDYMSASGWSNHDIFGYRFEKNKIWYTATSKITPYNTSYFDSGIKSNEWDSSTGKGVITFYRDITKIGDEAFRECTSLESVIIPNGVTTIGRSAFYYCTSLIDITIPDSVTSISYNAFLTCSVLRSVTIPERVTAIGKLAFSSCSRLIAVYCKATTPPTLGSDVFNNNAIGRKIYVPAESVSAYKSADGWSSYASDIIGYDFEKNEIVKGESSGNYTVTLNNAWRASTSVYNPNTMLYDGVYESYSNYNVNNGVATMYIDIEGYTEFSIYIRSDAESSYDYVTVSELDSTSVKASTSGNQKSGNAISNYTQVTYKGIDGGSHRITIKYRKDGSYNEGSDRGYLLIPKY